ncbi:mitotic interactor and substrate of PLK1 isoform X2 [Amia ocellicauda]|uniref:mitotic interactor and substrate of PLK1 isoform X2 n=1 Tax=Amia ocellicauda TaxID=2972642 RepID=UPI00346475A1
MESVPKNWILRTLSPKLSSQTDCTARSETQLESSFERRYVNPYGSEADTHIYSHENITVMCSQPSVMVTPGLEDGMKEVVVHAKQVSILEWEKGEPQLSPETAGSPGSQSGFYSFVDVETNPEAEKTEDWMSSPEREAKLATLKVENGFKLRAYQEDRKPDKLFSEENGDSHYRVPDANGSLGEQELESERWDIIRSQAPKKNPTFTEQWSALEQLDLANSPNKLMEGFSLHFSAANGESSHKAEAGNVDTEQINFSAARQQFLKMEQSNFSSFLQIPRQLQSPRNRSQSPVEEAMVTAIKVNFDDHTDKRPTQTPENSPVFFTKSVTVTLAEDGSKGVKKQSSFFDDFDSGLGESSWDLGGGYASDGSISNEVFVSESSKAKVETPIEREIRVAQEREESLRRERGILRSKSREMVQIRTKPLLSQDDQATPLPALSRTKDKGRVSFFVQREIERESQREEDLLQEGKVPGLYDRGKPQELGERKRVFELQADEVPVMPTRMSLSGTLVDAKTKSGTEEGRATPDAMLVLEDKASVDTEEYLSPCCPHRHQDETAFRSAVQSAHVPQRDSSEEKKYTKVTQPLPSRGEPCLSSKVGLDVQYMTPNKTVGSPKLSIFQKPASLSQDKYSESLVAVESSTVPASVTDPTLLDLARNPSGHGSPKGFLRFSSVKSPLEYILGKDSFKKASVRDTPGLGAAKGSSDLSSPGDSPGLGIVGEPKFRWTGQNEQFNLKTRKVQTPEAIRREIEDYCKREQELRQLRGKSGLSLSQDGDWDGLDQTPIVQMGRDAILLFSEDAKGNSVEQEMTSPTVAPAEELRKEEHMLLPQGFDTVDHAMLRITPQMKMDSPGKSASPVDSPRLAPRISLVTMVTAQPWGSLRSESLSTPPGSPVTPLAKRMDNSFAAKGLTETLMGDFEEYRLKLKRDENAYAGIQPSDDVNNEVVEATRVIRHKNTRALRWEAGMYANEVAD